MNICTLTDSYKFTHHSQYPKGTEAVYSYFESRTGAQFDETVFFGLQYLIKKHLVGQVVTQAKIDAAASLADAHVGPGIFNREGWEHILNVHDGYLPIRIRAVAEGTPVPTNNVLMTVENTDPYCFWLTNHLETVLTHVWYSSTVATLSRHVKKMIKKYLTQTAMSNAGLDFMLHDFGFRGTSSVESAGIGGLGHLVNFQGTDTLRAIETGMEYYNSGVCAFSVPATEHSVMTSNGPEGEEAIVAQLLENHPTGLLSVVGDSYDIFDFASVVMGETFKEAILARDGVFVIRPDSGDPITTVLKLLMILGEKFGYETNDKGFKVLNPKVRIIWGDGLDYTMIEGILFATTKEGWSAENLVFGMGGGLLQKINRDTQRFAFKCSAQQRDGGWHDVWKDPIDKSKASKRGRLQLVDVAGYQTAPDNGQGGLLRTVFLDGEMHNITDFESIRARAAI